MIDSKIIIEALKLIKKNRILDLGMEINKMYPNFEIGDFPFRMLFSITPEKYKDTAKNRWLL